MKELRVELVIDGGANVIVEIARAKRPHNKLPIYTTKTGRKSVESIKTIGREQTFYISSNDLNKARDTDLRAICTWKTKAGDEHQFEREFSIASVQKGCKVAESR